MTNDPRLDWKREPVTIALLDPDQLRSTASRFDRRIFWRNVRELAGAALVVLLFGWEAATASSAVERVGALLVVGAALFVSVVLVTRGRHEVPPHALAPDALKQWWKRQLDRQARLLERVRLWYIAPFLPGLALLLLAPLLSATGADRPAALFQVAFGGIAILLVLFVVDRLNRKAARDLRARIAELD